MEGEGEVSLTICNSSSSSQSLARLYKTSLQAMLEEYQSKLQAAPAASHSEDSDITRQISAFIVLIMLL